MSQDNTDSLQKDKPTESAEEKEKLILPAVDTGTKTID
jgi:hypothetical protein